MPIRGHAPLWSLPHFPRPDSLCWPDFPHGLALWVSLAQASVPAAIWFCVGLLGLMFASARQFAALIVSRGGQPSDYEGKPPPAQHVGHRCDIFYLCLACFRSRSASSREASRSCSNISAASTCRPPPRVAGAADQMRPRTTSPREFAAQSWRITFSHALADTFRPHAVHNERLSRCPFWGRQYNLTAAGGSNGI